MRLTRAYLAKELGDKVGIPAFFVDPVCVDEFLMMLVQDTLTGMERQSSSRQSSQLLKGSKGNRKRLGEDLNLVVVHPRGGEYLLQLTRRAEL